MEEKKKFPKWLLIILIVVVVVFILTVIFCGIGGLLFGNAVKEVAEEEVAKVETSETKDNSKNSDYKMTDTSFENSDFSLNLGTIDPNYQEEYMDLKENMRVVQIPVTFKNLTKKDMLVDSFNAKSENKMMDEYYSMGDDVIAFESLLSGTTLDGMIYYEVPKDSKELILVYDYGLFTEKKIEFKLDVTMK